MKNDDIIKDLYSGFSKPEILNLAEELGIQTSLEMRAKVLISTILDNLEAEGVPEWKDCSKLMREFLESAEFCDANGNLIEKVSEEKSSPQAKEEVKVIDADKLPGCYTLADERDPSCMKCKLLNDCKTERLNKRPPCFGKLFDKNAEECQNCIEAAACRTVVDFNKVAIEKSNQIKGKR